MTTPQSGREAFEAWAEREFGKVPRGAVLGLPATERFASYWKCWQAALAQQGREVGEALVDGVVAIDGRPYLVSDPEHFVRTEKAQRLYTAAPKQQAVSEADILWLRKQVRHGPFSHSFIKDEKRCEVCKRLAKIDAALPGKTEVEAVGAPKQQAVEWRPIETAPKDGSRIMLANEHGVWMADWRPVYQSGYRPENPWGSAMLNHDHIPREVRYVRATHWKPLPALPGKTEVDRG